MFSFDATAVSYPSQQEVLESIQPVLNPQPRYANEASGLSQAAHIGSLGSVQYFLEQRVDPNLQDNSGSTALMHAATGGYLDVVNALLAAGVDFDLQDNSGSTALMRAASKGHIGVVNALLAKGAKLDLQNNLGLTALMITVLKGRLGIVKEILAKKVKLDLRDNFGSTALMFAVSDGYLDIVKALLANGADVNLQNGADRTALMLATKRGDLAIVEVLLAKGAVVSVFELGNVAMNGGREITAMLLNGHGIEQVPYDDIVAVVDIAIRHKNFDIAKAILDKALEINRENHSNISELKELHSEVIAEEQEFQEQEQERELDCRRGQSSHQVIKDSLSAVPPGVIPQVVGDKSKETSSAVLGIVNGGVKARINDAVFARFLLVKQVVKPYIFKERKFAWFSANYFKPQFISAI
jgi:ankyrin repeat protein